MKRGNVGSRETKSRPDPIIIRARVNDTKPEPVRVLKLTHAPELGKRFKVCRRASAQEYAPEDSSTSSISKTMAA